MKKKLFLLLMLSVSLATAEAQSWKLVINKADGQTIELATSDIQDIQFVSQEEELPTLPDQNVDQIIIKEIYNGGCPMDEGTDMFQMDKCIILYNNCPQQAVVNNLCFGMATPYNAEAPSINSIYDGTFVADEKEVIMINVANGGLSMTEINDVKGWLTEEDLAVIADVYEKLGQDAIELPEV